MTRYIRKPVVAYEIPSNHERRLPETTLLMRPEPITAGNYSEKSAEQIQQILHDAYAASYEGEGRPITPGGIRRYLFDPEDPEAFMYHASRSIEARQSVYYLAYAMMKSTKALHAAGIFKVTDSMPGYLRKLRQISHLDIQGNAFVNDVVVAPEMQGRGIGDALMYEALQGYDSDKLVLVDALPHQENQAWFNRLGMSVTALEAKVVEVGDEQLIPTRMQGLVGDARAYLLQQHEWLESREELTIINS